MRYALLVLAPPQAAAVHRAAIGLCEAALCAGHALPRVFFSDAGGLARHGLAAGDLPAFVTVLDPAAQRELQDRHEHLLSF